MEEQDLVALIDQSIFLQRNAHPSVNFIFERPDHPVVVACDSQQIGRALTNLLQNAIDAIDWRDLSGVDPLPPGQITLQVVEEASTTSITIEDNGPGLPKADRNRLTEPYVTTREHGTGLGLAIVKKIMEDHGGNLRLEDSPAGGAKVALVFQVSEEPAASSHEQQPAAKGKASGHGR